MKKELIGATIERDEVALLLCKHYGRLKQMARYFYNDRDNVLDLVQDTICKVMASESLGGVRNVSDLFGLCNLTMRSVFYNDWNKEVLFKRIEVRSEDDYGPSDGLADAEGGMTIDTIRKAAVRDERVAAALYKGEGYTEREIADRQGTPLGTAKSRIFSGRRIIRSL